MKLSLDLVPGMRHLWHQEALAIPGLGPALDQLGHVPNTFLIGQDLGT